MDCDDCEICCCCDGLGFVVVSGDCPLCDGSGSLGDHPVLLTVARAIVEGSGCDGDLRPPCYIAADLPGRGVGLLATRDIVAGTLIMAEAPLLTVSGTETLRREIGRGTTLSDSVETSAMRSVNVLCSQDANLNLAVASSLRNLGDMAQGQFLSLADSFCGLTASAPPVLQSFDCKVAEGGLHSDKDAPTVAGIFLTNAVSDSSGDISHVYSDSSRINHSCRPNAVVMARNGTRQVYAAEAIGAGIEICISYIEDFSSEKHAGLQTSVRVAAETLCLDGDLLLVALFRQQLFVKWGFWCGCSRCGPIAARCDEVLAAWSGY